MVKDKSRKGRKIKPNPRKSPRKSAQKTPKTPGLRATPTTTGFGCPVCSKKYQSKSGFINHKCESSRGTVKKKVPVESLVRRKSSKKNRQPLNIQLDPNVVDMSDHSSRPLTPDSSFKPFQCQKCLVRFEHRRAFIQHKNNSKCNEPPSLDQRINELHEQVLNGRSDSSSSQQFNEVK